METKDLLKVVAKDLAGRIKECPGLNVFAQKKSSFEQWIQVAICSSLIEQGIRCTDIRVEEYLEGWSPDIIFNFENQKVIIELKNKIAEGGGGRTSLSGIIEDIEEIKKALNGYKGAVIFVIYPLAEDGREKWKKSKKNVFNTIQSSLDAMGNCEFEFDNNGGKGIIYWGMVKK